jgi:ABC-type transporter Mla subunit MlaD
VEPLKYQRWIGAGVIALLAGVVAFKLARDTRKIGPGMTVWVQIGHAGPLVQGSKVRVAGLTVGQVEEVSFLRGEKGETPKVSLKLWISRRHAWLLHEKSEYFVNQPALLSEPYLEVGIARDGDPGPELQDGAVVKGIDPASIDQLLTRSYALMREMGATLHNEFPEIDDLVREIDALEVTFTDLAKAPVWRSGSFARLFVEGARTKLFFDAVSDETSRLPMTVQKARALVDGGRAAIAGLRAKVDTLMARVDGLRGQLSPEKLARLDAVLAQVDELTRQIDQVMASADALVATIESGKGSIAAFAADMEIADEMKAMTKLLKEQPWRMGHPMSKDKKSGLP